MVVGFLAKNNILEPCLSMLFVFVLTEPRWSEIIFLNQNIFVWKLILSLLQNIPKKISGMVGSSKNANICVEYSASFSSSNLYHLFVVTSERRKERDC